MIRKFLNPLAIPRLILFLVLLLGSYFRFYYLLRSGPFVDEFATLLAAKGIVERGLPILPSGLLYGHGPLSSYLEAPFVYLFGLDTWMARLPDLLLGLLTIPLVYLAGRRISTPRAGLIAALLLTLDGEAIIWSGRARPYALEQSLALLAVLLFYEAGTREEGSPYLWAGSLAFLAALFAHAESVFLFFPLFLGLLLLMGPRRALRWKVGAAFLLCGLGVVTLLLLQEWMGMGERFETISRSRPLFVPSWDLVKGLRPLASFFLSRGRIIPTILALGGLGLLLRERKHEARLKVAFLYLILGLALAEMATLIGQSWQHPRYIFLLLPIFFLCSAVSLEALLSQGERALGRVGVGTPGISFLLTAIALSVLLLFSVPGAIAASGQRELGYEQAFNYVRERWRADDKVMTVSPAACGVYLPRCDFFAIQKGYEIYVMRERGGIWIDRWLGSALLDSVEALSAALQGGSRVWFVVDGERFRTRYEGDFKELVEEEMMVVFQYEGVLVFQTKG